MGSPKAARGMVKQRICRRRFGVLFAAALVAVVLALFVFSDLFAQDANGELSMVSQLNEYLFC
jgi:type VI protein secretion system component VasF